MSLVPCNKCGKMISDLANVCPNCGTIIVKPESQTIKNNNRKNKNKKILIIGGIVATILVIMLLPDIVYMCTSGEQYYQKYQTSENKEKGIEYLKNAVKKEHPEAMFIYGTQNVSDEYPHERKVEGVKWIRKSAEAGYPPAQGAYGIILINENIIPKDVAEGYKWLEKSAENGLGVSQKMLAVAYLKGNEGLPFDLEKGKYWLNKAAEQNVDGAADMLEYLNYIQTHSLANSINLATEFYKGNVRNLGRIALQNELGYY